MFNEASLTSVMGWGWGKKRADEQSQEKCYNSLLRRPKGCLENTNDWVSTIMLSYFFLLTGKNFTYLIYSNTWCSRLITVCESEFHFLFQILGLSPVPSRQMVYISRP